jgi:hypothetical protein
MHFLDRIPKLTSRDVTTIRTLSTVDACRLGERCESQGPGRPNVTNANQESPKTTKP